MLTRAEAASLSDPLDPARRGVPGAPGRDATLAWRLGAAAVVLGSLLPWATVSGPGGRATTSGLATDGRLTLTLGLVLTLLAARHLSRRRWRAPAAAGTAALVLLVATVNALELWRFAADVAPDLGVAARAGAGLWCTLLGAMVTLVAIGAGARRPLPAPLPAALPGREA